MTLNANHQTRNILVTGASRGVGAVTARRAGALGFKVAVNYASDQSAAQAVVDNITNAGGGAIVNVSSMAAVLGSPNEYIDYAASKGALDTLTVGLSKEVAREGIRVNGVRPGIVYTGIHATAGEPGRVDRLKDGIPLGRGGQPEEIADAILWLLGPESSYITGTTINVSGGR